MTTTTSAAPASATGRREAKSSDYSALLRQIQAKGLMERRYGYYAIKVTAVLGAYAGVWWAFFQIGSSWWQLLVAVAFALVLAHLSFLSHDAAHRQIFRSGPANELFASVVASLLCGMSAAWWTAKHTRHHAAPNQVGKDPDIEPAIVRFHVEAPRRRSPMVEYLAGRQGWWFFPILVLEGVNLHLQSVQTLLRRGPVRHRRLELTLMTVRLGGYVAVLLVFLPVGIAVLFLAVQLAALGVYLGCSFAPNHKGMPLLPADAKVDFLRRQVLMSRNITGNRLITFAMGGLNYQIEHHLFPSMPRPTLRRAQVTVRQFCLNHSVSYTEMGLRRSYGLVVRHLNKVGLGERDPFTCPLVASYRPRS